jgi:hypothetical protein
MDWSGPIPRVRVKGEWVPLADVTRDQLNDIASGIRQRASVTLRRSIVRALTEGLSVADVQAILSEELARLGE